jgi:hypothetical protein
MTIDIMHGEWVKAFSTALHVSSQTQPNTIAMVLIDLCMRPEAKEAMLRGHMKGKGSHHSESESLRAIVA